MIAADKTAAIFYGHNKMAISVQLGKRLKLLKKRADDAEVIASVSLESATSTVAGGYDTEETLRKLKQARANISGFIAASDSLYDNVNDILFPLVGTNAGSIKELPVSDVADGVIAYRIPEKTVIVEIPVNEGNFKIICTQDIGIRYGVSLIANGVVTDDVEIGIYIGGSLRLTTSLTALNPQQLITVGRDSSVSKIAASFGVDIPPTDTPAVKLNDDIEGVQIEVIDGTTSTSVKTVNFHGAYLDKRKKMKIGTISTSTPSIQTDVTDAIAADDRFLFVNNRTINMYNGRILVPRRTGSEMVASNNLIETQATTLPSADGNSGRRFAVSLHCFNTNYVLTTDTMFNLYLCRFNESLTSFNYSTLTLDEPPTGVKPIMLDYDNGIFAVFTSASTVGNIYIVKINKTTGAMSILNKTTLTGTTNIQSHKIAGHNFVSVDRSDASVSFYRYDVESKTLKSVQAPGFLSPLSKSIFVRDTSDISTEIYFPSTGAICTFIFNNGVLTSSVTDTTVTGAGAVLRTALGDYQFLVAGATSIGVYNRHGDMIKITNASNASIHDVTQIEGSNYLLVLIGSSTKTTMLVRVDNDGALHYHSPSYTGDVQLSFAESAGKHYIHRFSTLWVYSYEINFAERALGWQEIIKR